MDTQHLNVLLNLAQTLSTPVISPRREDAPEIPWDAELAFVDGAVQITGMSEACGGGFDLIVIMPLTAFNEHFTVEFQSNATTDTRLVDALSDTLPFEDPR